MDGLRGYLEEDWKEQGPSLSKNKSRGFLLCIGVKERVSLRPHGTDNPLSTVSIGLEDVIIPSRANGWGNGKLLDWIDCIKKGHDPLIEDGIRYWVNIRDVVEAITTISMFEGKLGSSDQIKICGRRGWKDEHIIDEIRVLWERYSNSINHSHTIESLSGVPGPARGIDSEDQSSRSRFIT